MENLIVQKYGGTSVGSTERIKAVAQRIINTVNGGNRVVVVVSAMGKTTDTLVQLAQDITPHPCRREMDMLLSTGEQVSIALLTMALQAAGQDAISLTGAQVGIVTEAEHSRARILEIKPERVQGYLSQSKVVVVAGFQGVSGDENFEITTLGRGGSDTSAVALAAALQAKCCEIYTDVPGILTTDPRIVKDAQLMPEITSDEMLELASLGAKVLHPRAVEIARNYGVQLVVRSSWTNDPGTAVVSPPRQDRPLVGLEITKAVDAVQHDRNQGKVALLRVPDRPGVAAQLFGEIAHQGIDVDLIIQSIHEGNSNDIAFSVAESTLDQAQAVATAIAPKLGNPQESEAEVPEVLSDRRVAKIAIAGAGMIGRPGIAATMFKTLAAAGVNLEMISTSEVKVSCVVAESDLDRAIAALCGEFEIESSPMAQSGETGDTNDQDPPVRGVALDDDQAQLAIRQVPDRPGMAAEIFWVLAEKNISVDMIIQSQRCHLVQGEPTRDIAFTVNQGDAQGAKAALEALAKTHDFGAIDLDDQVAKISIVGSGMANHPGIAAEFFQALASHGINIQMITTSEIKVSCVVPRSQGVEALQVVHRAFGLGGEKKVEVPA